MRLILIVIFFAAIFSACANVSRFQKDSLTAHGELFGGSKEPLYYSIRIDIASSADERPMSFLMKLSPDSPPIASNRLYPELVARYLPPFTPPSQWPDTWKQKAKEEDIYSGNGFDIIFKNGKLLSIGICSHCAGRREYPIVGSQDGKHFYTLPLTEQEVTEVFGSPDRIYKVNEVRY